MVGEVSIDIVIVIYVDNILVGSKDMESEGGVWWQNKRRNKKK